MSIKLAPFSGLINLGAKAKEYINLQISTISGLVSSGLKELDEGKQDVLIGNIGQVLGFNDSGAPTPIRSYVNENHLTNPYFLNPVNTKNKKTYEVLTEEITIDDWFGYNGTTVTLSDGDFILSYPKGDESQGYYIFAELVKDYEKFKNKIVTFSALISQVNGPFMLFAQFEGSYGLNVYSPPSSSFGILSITFKVPENSDRLIVGFSSVDKTPVDIHPVCAKIEFGDRQTLAHKESDGGFVLDDIPNKDVEFLKSVGYLKSINLIYDNLLSGGVPYGKELTESWAALQARIKAGNFAGIHIGDFKTITLTTGETVIMEVAGIDQYYRCCDLEVGHHVDFISRDCLSGTKAFNDANTNNGTGAEPNPWRASKLFRTMNDETTGVFSTLSADLKPCIIEKRALLESRFSEAGALNDSTGRAWNNMGKLWLPTEVEVFGNSTWSDEGLGAGGGGRNKQYPIFIGNSLHLIKGNGNGGARYSWWEASALRASSAGVCCVTGNGDTTNAPAASDWLCVSLCFRIG